MSVSKKNETQQKTKEKQRNDVSEIFTSEDMGNMCGVFKEPGPEVGTRF